MILVKGDHQDREQFYPQARPNQTCEALPQLPLVRSRLRPVGQDDQRKEGYLGTSFRKDVVVFLGIIGGSRFLSFSLKGES